MSNRILSFVCIIIYKRFKSIVQFSCFFYFSYAGSICCSFRICIYDVIVCRIKLPFSIIAPGDTQKSTIHPWCEQKNEQKRYFTFGKIKTHALYEEHKDEYQWQITIVNSWVGRFRDHPKACWGQFFSHQMWKLQICESFQILRAPRNNSLQGPPNFLICHWWIHKIDNFTCTLYTSTYTGRVVNGKMWVNLWMLRERERRELRHNNNTSDFIHCDRNFFVCSIN